MTLILSNADVEQCLPMQECIAVLEDAYVELSEGRGVNRVRSDCLVPTLRGDALYSLKSMDGVIPKLGIGAVRIDSDVVTWPKQGNAMRRDMAIPAPLLELSLFFLRENRVPVILISFGNRFLALAPAIAGV